MRAPGKVLGPASRSAPGRAGSRSRRTGGRPSSPAEVGGTLSNLERAGDPAAGHRSPSATGRPSRTAWRWRPTGSACTWPKGPRRRRERGGPRGALGGHRIACRERPWVSALSPDGKRASTPQRRPRTTSRGRTRPREGVARDPGGQRSLRTVGCNVPEPRAVAHAAKTWNGRPGVRTAQRACRVASDWREGAEGAVARVQQVREAIQREPGDGCADAALQREVRSFRGDVLLVARRRWRRRRCRKREREPVYGKLEPAPAAVAADEREFAPRRATRSMQDAPCTRNVGRAASPA